MFSKHEDAVMCMCMCARGGGREVPCVLAVIDSSLMNAVTIAASLPLKKSEKDPGGTSSIY